MKKRNLLLSNLMNEIKIYKRTLVNLIFFKTKVSQRPNFFFNSISFLKIFFLMKAINKSNSFLLEYYLAQFSSKILKTLIPLFGKLLKIRCPKRQTLVRVLLNQFFWKIAGTCNFTHRLRILKKKIKKKYRSTFFQ